MEDRPAIQVRLTLFGNLARFLPEGNDGRSAILDVGGGTTVAGLLDSVEVPPDQRGYVTVNGERASLEAALADGDEVRVIIPLGGG